MNRTLARGIPKGASLNTARIVPVDVDEEAEGMAEDGAGCGADCGGNTNSTIGVCVSIHSYIRAGEI